MPKEIFLESEFGTYKTYLYLEALELTYIRKREIYKGIFLPEKYDAFANYMNAIIKADRSSIVLYKK